MPIEWLDDEPPKKSKIEWLDDDAAIAADIQPAPSMEAPQQATTQGYDGGMFRGLTDAVKTGVMFGFDDEIKGGMAALPAAAINFAKGDGFNLGEQYNKFQQQFDVEKQARREAMPISSTVGEIVGGLASGGGLAKSGLTLAGKATSAAGRIGAAATEAGAYGALYGAGEAKPGERLEGAATGAAIGAITGGLAEGAVTAAVRRKVLKETIPASTDLKAASQSLYKEAENANVRMTQPAFSSLVTRMKNAAGRVNEKLHPKATGAIEVLEKELGRSPSLQDIDDMRRILSGAAQKADPSDQRLLNIMVDKMDEFIDKAPAGVLTGDQRGVRYWREAQTLWQKKAKAEVVEDIMEKARNQATGFENGMRVQFRQLANNKKRFNRFNPSERQAILKIVRGGPMENTLRAIGWLSPTGVFGALTTGAVGAGTGILPAAAMSATGYTARKGAEALTRGNVGALDRTIKLGTSQVALPTSKLTPFLAGSAIGGQAVYPKR